MFKIGDRVKTFKGDGTVVAIDPAFRDYGVELDNYSVYNHDLYYPSVPNCPKVKEGHGWWFTGDKLTLLPIKVGDRVKSSRFGEGTVVKIHNDRSIGVRYDKYNHALHSLRTCGEPTVELGHGWWESADNLILISKVISFTPGLLPKKEVVWALYECADDLPGTYKSGRIHGLYASKDLAEKDRLEILSNANKVSGYVGYLAVLQFGVKK